MKLISYTCTLANYELKFRPLIESRCSLM